MNILGRRVERNFLIVFLSFFFFFRGMYTPGLEGWRRCCESMIASRILMNRFDRERVISTFALAAFVNLSRGS